EGDPVAGRPEEFAPRVGPRTAIAGSGADAVAAVLAGGSAARVVHRHAAADVAALLRLARSAPLASGPPRPLYLRPPDAKPQVAARIARR
ncbi:MAG: tRNA (adenosine(37)-N6)-threonylcarbamoyltransferase complex dimerization subunit type 1 TsaB, partial [Bauldia sp.]